MSPIRRLTSLRRAELPVDTVELARFLIGKVVVRDLEFVRLIGRIVETEAYPIGDYATQWLALSSVWTRLCAFQRKNSYPPLSITPESSHCYRFVARHRGVNVVAAGTALPQRAE